MQKIINPSNLLLLANANRHFLHPFVGFKQNNDFPSGTYSVSFTVPNELPSPFTAESLRRCIIRYKTASFLVLS